MARTPDATPKPTPKTTPQPTADPDRREFLHGAAAAGAAFALTGRIPFVPGGLAAQEDAVLAQIPARHDVTLKMLRDWIALPSIAAEDLGYPEGPEYMAQLARDAGFDHVEVVPTKGKAGVFATLDVGAPNTLGLYFMYDVKQYDASEWSSPPLEGRLVDRPGLGKVIIGRGATNTKGPQTACLAALHAFKAAGQTPPVNIVLVCEGEEEIGSPNFGEVVFKPEVAAALKRCVGVVIPLGNQGADGSVTINLGAKGIVELELVSSGERWGRGPKQDVHSSYEAIIDSPAWHLVRALHTLVGPDGHTPVVEGFFDAVRPLSERQRQILETAIAEGGEEETKRGLGIDRFFADESYHDAMFRLVTQPTINIEGLVGGYTGPGGKTILPHRAVAKIDMRLVPDMTTKGTLDLLRAHLARQGFGDIEVNMTGGYDPTETDPDSKLIAGQIAAYRAQGVEPSLWPRLAGSWPGVTFTGAPLRLAAGMFGMGIGGGAHAPDEWYLIESSNPKVAGLDGAVRSYVELMRALA